MTKKLSRQQRWYQENKDRALANDKTWRDAHPNRVSQRNKDYREAFKKKHGMSISQFYYRKRNSGKTGPKNATTSV